MRNGFGGGDYKEKFEDIKIPEGKKYLEPILRAFKDNSIDKGIIKEITTTDNYWFDCFKTPIFTIILYLGLCMEKSEISKEEHNEICGKLLILLEDFKSVVPLKKGLNNKEDEKNLELSIQEFKEYLWIKFLRHC
ncbi:MAG: hypothetical protein PHF46_03505 [Candidatus Gracilibacteria bacterium]|nr:hypothetical protein [Candidatus Gracilibacteria bacterium]MDD3120447.1 hypothetical protein [Candidatus Gracilibacteria bacterium]MDD4530481.1 hypothetical protein [Candidatus Gracilibacteria bacterium]